MLSLSAANFYPAINQGIWPLFRVLALFSTAPVFSEKSINKKVKISLAVLLTVLIAPMLPVPDIHLFSLDGVLLAVQQIIIGCVMGLTAQFIFVAVKNAGEIIGLQMGLSFATFFDPVSGGNMPKIERFLNLLAGILFLAYNGHLWMINVLVDSFNTFPVNGTMLNPEGFLYFAKSADLIFKFGILLGLPIITLLLCINFTLGLLNRLTPQLSIFVIGFPLTLTVGMLALSLIMYTLAPSFESMMAMMFELISQLFSVLAGA